MLFRPPPPLSRSEPVGDCIPDRNDPPPRVRKTDDRERKPIAPLVVPKRRPPVVPKRRLGMRLAKRRFAPLLSFPSSAWECVPAKLCFASPPSLPIPDSFPRLRFAKQSLAGRIPKQRLGTTKKNLTFRRDGVIIRAMNAMNGIAKQPPMRPAPNAAANPSIGSRTTKQP